MASNKEVVLTSEGLKKLEDELEYLRGQKRREIAERIKQALSFGDLSENSEYDEAKNEQAQVEVRIVQLEKILKNAKIIDENEVTTDVVSVGSIVKLLHMESQEEVEYLIVGSTEADPNDFKISNESPVGAALIGRKVGEVVEIEVPNIREKLWKEHFWSQSFCLLTTGGASISIIKKYIESQGKKSKKKE